MGEEGSPKLALVILVALFVKFQVIIKYFIKSSFDGRISNIFCKRSGIKAT